MAERMQVRRDTAANWTSSNPILAQGEWGFETDTEKIKIGDGLTAWTLLDYHIDTSWVDITSEVSFESITNVSMTAVKVYYNKAISLVKCLGTYNVSVTQLPADTLLFTVPAEYRAVAAHRFASTTSHTPAEAVVLLVNNGQITTKEVTNINAGVYVNTLEWIIGV